MDRISIYAQFFIYFWDLTLTWSKNNKKWKTYLFVDYMLIKLVDGRNQYQNIVKIPRLTYYFSIAHKLVSFELKFGYLVQK